MEQVVFYAPDIYCMMLNNLKKIPFSKTDDGYQFAYWVYDLNVSEEDQQQLLSAPRGKEANAFLEKARKDLESITVTEEDYLKWTVYKKDKGGVEQYHKIIHDLSIKLFMLAIDKTADDIIECGDHRDSSTFYTPMASSNQDSTTRYVLNRNNPFADVTIKSQQFFYKTETGEVETLFFDTNNIVEKTDKNGRDMLTMRPGFSVSKEYGVVKKPVQNITFANSLTEPIVDDEDHIYIHID